MSGYKFEVGDIVSHEAYDWCVLILKHIDKEGLSIIKKMYRVLDLSNGDIVVLNTATINNGTKVA